MKHPEIEVIAHRGYSERTPENTLAALRAAIDAGADAIEFDLHVTRDGSPVLFHDFTLERTTDGRGRIDETTLQQLRELDAGAWFGDAFRGEHVPTLVEALELAAAARAPHGPLRTLYPEIKGWRDDADIRAIVAALQDTGWLEHAVVISLDWDALAAVREAAPGLRIGFVYDDPRLHEEAVALAAEDGRALIDPDHRLLLRDPGLVSAARGRGIELACWTVNDPDDALRLLDMGVRRLTTNRVDAILDAIRR